VVSTTPFSIVSEDWISESALVVIGTHDLVLLQRVSAVVDEGLVWDVKGPCLDSVARRVENRNHVPSHRIFSERRVNNFRNYDYVR
jgi:hypothetical protein